MAAKIATPDLVKVLTDKDSSQVRSRAAEALGKLGNASPEVLQGLLALLTDQESQVRSRAAYALGNLGNASKDFW